MTKASEYRNMSVEDLEQRLKDLEESLFNLRIRATTKELENPVMQRYERRELARVKTILHEKGVVGK